MWAQLPSQARLNRLHARSQWQVIPPNFNTVMTKLIRTPAFQLFSYLPPLNPLLGYLSFWFTFSTLLSCFLSLSLITLLSFGVLVGLLESSHSSNSSRLRWEFFAPTGKSDRWTNRTEHPSPWAADDASAHRWSSLVCQPPLTSPVEMHCTVNACPLRALWGTTDFWNCFLSVEESGVSCSTLP